MLPSLLRFDLRHSPQFFEHALSFQDRHIRFLYLENKKITSQTTENKLQTAIIVPKRHGKATDRVKTKRLIRAAINDLSKELSSVFELPYSVVLFVKGSPQEYEQYHQELKKLFLLLHKKSTQRE